MGETEAPAESRRSTAIPSPYGHRASVLLCRRATRCTLRCARRCGEIDNADNAERLLRNLARRLDGEAPGVAASILEELDEMRTSPQARAVRRAGTRREHRSTKSRSSLAGDHACLNPFGRVIANETSSTHFKTPLINASNCGHCTGDRDLHC